MNRELLKRLQKISHRLNMDKTEVAQEFTSQLRQKLAARGYRADLTLTTDAKDTSGRFLAAVAFNSQLGHPDEKDIMSIVSQAYPKHDIDWELTQVDSDLGIVLIPLTPSTEVVPVQSVTEIPPEFVSIGAGIYKRAADASGRVNEIWTLKRTDNGLALFRNNEDMDVQAGDDNEMKAGDAVKTPHGIGRILRFDDTGNAIVQVGNAQRLVAKADLLPYRMEKEKQSLVDYFAQAYGDKEFARALVEQYSSQKKK